MEITEIYQHTLSLFSINKEVPLFELFKDVLKVIFALLLLPFGKMLLTKYRNYNAEKTMRKNVNEDLMFIMEKLKNKNFMTIISDNTISEQNMYTVNKYFEFLKDKGDKEANDYLSIKNLFEKNEKIKSKLHQYINVRNGGILKSELMKDPNFGILCKNYIELEQLINEKINIKIN